MTLLPFFSYILIGDTQRLCDSSLVRIMYIWYKLETVYYSKSEIRSQIHCSSHLTISLGVSFEIQIGNSNCLLGFSKGYSVAEA